MSSRTDLGVAPGSSSSCTRTSKIVSDEHSVILMDETHQEDEEAAMEEHKTKKGS